MRLRLAALVVGLVTFCAAPAFAGPLYPFNDGPDNMNDSYDFHYAITGGKFPTGNQPNGTRASGGTMAFITDDPGWGYDVNVWHRDSWFEQTSGQAMTFKNNGAIVYDNNGIEDHSYGDFYDAQAQGRTQNVGTPGLHQNYAMANNYDWIYASYFLIEAPLEIDQIIGYFNGDGYYNTLDPTADYFNFRFNIWSTEGDCDQPNVGCLPVNTGGFNGDVFNSDLHGSSYSVSYTGADRVFVGGATDPIWRVVFTLDQPFTLQPGEYYGGHDVVIVDPPSDVPEPVSLVLLGLGLLGAGFVRRRSRN